MGSRKLWIIIFLVFAGLQLTACNQESKGGSKIPPVKVEEIKGSEFKRVILTQKAAERLDIQTALVHNEEIVRTRTVGGSVVDLPVGSGLPVVTGTTSSAMWVNVRLAESDLNQVDQDKPAEILDIDDQEAEGVMAEPDESPGFDDPEDTTEEGTESLYYRVDNPKEFLTPGGSVLVNLTLTSNVAQKKTLPYDAVIYGVNGETWVYTNPEPLVYIREPITIDYIEDNQAVLLKGPAVGTKVVTVGVAELFGAETGVSK